MLGLELTRFEFDDHVSELFGVEEEQAKKPTSGVGALLGNIVWVVLAGWWLAIVHIVSGIALCVTIIGIPMGIADFKMVPISLMPLGKQIVSTRSGAFDKTL